MRFLASVLVMLLVSGCSDSTGPSFPNAEGQYSGEWETLISFGDLLVDDHCSGHVSISSQTDAEISGEIVMEEGGAFDAFAEAASGTITTGGKVELHLPEVEALWEAQGCSGDMGLNGSLNGDRLTLELGPVVCVEESDTATLEVFFSGSR